jgi:nicotinamide mononucleotide (NMN) deamidase PncC
MARGARTLLGADVAVSVTGVAGPEEQDGQVPGTVFAGIAIGETVSHVALRLPGDRARVRTYAAISALDALRKALDATL